MPEVLGKVLLLWLDWNCVSQHGLIPVFITQLSGLQEEISSGPCGILHTLLQPNSQPETCREAPRGLLGPPPLCSFLFPGTLPWRISAISATQNSNLDLLSWAKLPLYLYSIFLLHNRRIFPGRKTGWLLVWLWHLIPVFSFSQVPQLCTLLLIIQYVKTVSSNILLSFMVISNGSQV